MCILIFPSKTGAKKCILYMAKNGKLFAYDEVTGKVILDLISGQISIQLFQAVSLFLVYMSFKNYFIDYAITIVPIFPSLLPSNTLHSLKQSPHHCSYPWVMHISSLATPFPTLYHPSPWLFCNYLLYFLIPSPLHLFPHTPLIGKSSKHSVSMILSLFSLFA